MQNGVPRGAKVASHCLTTTKGRYQGSLAPLAITLGPVGTVLGSRSLMHVLLLSKLVCKFLSRATHGGLGFARLCANFGGMLVLGK